MYIPRFNEQHDPAALRKLIHSRPFATWSTLVGGEIVVNHVPFLLDESRGVYGTLVGHVARANPVWKGLPATLESVVAFQGDDAYITPGWYPGKQEHGKVVPTWNYLTVHARGIACCIEDRDWLLAHVSALTDSQEADQDMPWRVDDAPDDYIETMLRAIVGIEIPISSLKGKWKLGQNRSDADQLGMLDGLRGGGEVAAGLVDELERYRQTRDE